ncbi:MAG: outer membrane lipoprotein-sorting protein [Colwellia sp.]|nr:MAG: outer membrane lipoprotein-sorting protein [Colwellia sp.]
MKNKSLLLAISVALASSSVSAKISTDDAEKLGKELTPMGAVQAANKDGSIPAWSGGITKAPASYQVGEHHVDPYPDDKVQYSITAKNVSDYKNLLTPGQIKLFETYPETFKMNVYQTRRSASYPSHVYDAVKINSTRAELVEGGNGIKNAAIGIPFPIPENGLEAIWNHTLRYRGEGMVRQGGQAAPTASGDYTYVGFVDQLLIPYGVKGTTPSELEKTNILFKFKQKVTEPARLAGTALLVHETMDQIKTPRQAWTYNTGQRRVRRAPNVAYDAPGSASDGLRLTDDFDMYNGAPNRYNWTLKGKQELLIPYNDYRLHSNKLKYSDILQPGHINPELVRYEKHRVWVVEASLKENTRHTYKKRIFFIDEDSWQVAIADIYDNRDELYRVAVAHGLNYYEVPTQWSTLEVYHDLQSRRYIAMGLDNEEKMYDFSVKLKQKSFTPSALRREGRR